MTGADIGATAAKASAEPPRPKRSLPRALLVEARPKQWIKNVLVAAAPAAAGIGNSAHIVWRIGVCFAAFCLVASGVYYLNDAADAEADRNHPTKRHRPIAAGEVPMPVAVGVGLLLFAGGIGLMAVLGLKPVVAVVTYVVMNVAYSAKLKHVAVVDLAFVAAGFIIRAVAGGLAADVPISRWFLIVASFGSLFMVAGKRYAEFAQLGEERGSARAALDGYTLSFLRYVWMISSGVAMAAYCLWAFEQSDGTPLDAATRTVVHPIWYELSIVPFVLALLRYALLIDTGHGAEPEEIVIGDRPLQILGLLWAAAFAIGVYA